jgi:N-acetyl-anhydromuramyl-L-alanine amidase AmpD
MTPKIPTDWMMPAEMRRIICHWTAGGYAPSENDLSHYHILIDGEARLHRGEHTIADNESAADGDYAAHVKGTNTGSIGVSMCCMAGAHEHPFDAGTRPMKPEQWDAMVAVVAQLCRAYGIAVTPRTVLGHGEVQANLGRPQKGKWDPMVLPFDRGLSQKQVGEKLRREVAAALATL